MMLLSLLLLLLLLLLLDARRIPYNQHDKTAPSAQGCQHLHMVDLSDRPGPDGMRGSHTSDGSCMLSRMSRCRRRIHQYNALFVSAGNPRRSLTGRSRRYSVPAASVACMARKCGVPMHCRRMRGHTPLFRPLRGGRSDRQLLQLLQPGVLFFSGYAGYVSNTHLISTLAHSSFLL